MTETMESREFKNMSVRAAVEYIRDKVGTYSIYLLNKDIQVLLQTDHPARTVAEQYTREKNNGVPVDVLDWIISYRTLPQPPEGYLALDALRKSQTIGFETLMAAIQKLLRLLNAPSEVLKNNEAYLQHAERLAQYCLYARGANGVPTIFFSPAGQDRIARMIEEQQRRPNGKVKKEALKLKPKKKKPATPTPEPLGHMGAVDKLRARIIAILDDLDDAEKVLAKKMLNRLTDTVEHTDALYMHQQILNLEASAKQNREE